MTDWRAGQGYKMGYIDTTGKTVVPPIYSLVHGFSEGLASVAIEDRKGNLKWGYIDTTGKEVIPLIYDDASDFSGGQAVVVKNGKMQILSK